MGSDTEILIGFICVALICVALIFGWLLPWIDEKLKKR